MGCYKVPGVSAFIAHDIRTGDLGSSTLTLYMLSLEASLKAGRLL
jgi:hypothetical protein